MENTAPYFNVKKVPDAEQKYVFWVDVSGTRSFMTRSVSQAANFVAKLHSVASQHLSGSLGYYPMNDGAFVVGEQVEIEQFSRQVMESMYRVFTATKNPMHQFFVRGAIAFGQVAEGSQLVKGLGEGSTATRFVERVVLGPPVSNAYASESNASPFGVIVHESARAGFKHMLFQWWNVGSAKASEKKRMCDEANEEILKYLDWCEEHPILSGLKTDQIHRYRTLTKEFFDTKDKYHYKGV